VASELCADPPAPEVRIGRHVDRRLRDDLPAWSRLPSREKQFFEIAFPRSQTCGNAGAGGVGFRFSRPVDRTANLIGLGPIARLGSVDEPKSAVLVHALKHVQGMGRRGGESHHYGQDEAQTNHPLPIGLRARILDPVVIYGEGD
jgi:hypothetical protein